ncbi:hypothetical protein B296_00046200, partial [Ensete ventricosum]
VYVTIFFDSWASGALDPESTASKDIVSSVKRLIVIDLSLFFRGVWAMIAVFLAYSLLQAPSTCCCILIRWHGNLYLVHSIYVFQGPYKAASCHLALGSWNGCGVPCCPHVFAFPEFCLYCTELPERSYGADCRIYVPDNPKSRFINVYETLFDEFVLAHIFGWWGKAIMIRNQPLLWVLSVGFELMEVCVHIEQRLLI